MLAINLDIGNVVLENGGDVDLRIGVSAGCKKARGSVTSMGEARRNCCTGYGRQL